MLVAGFFSSPGRLGDPGALHVLGTGLWNRGCEGRSMKSSRERLRTLLISAGTVVALVGIVAFGTARSNAASVPFKAFGHATSAGHDVLLVGNSVGGTVSFLDGTTFANLGSLNVIPDLAERLAAMNPIERAG